MLIELATKVPEILDDDRVRPNVASTVPSGYPIECIPLALGHELISERVCPIDVVVCS